MSAKATTFAALTVGLSGVAGAVLGHQGVQNPAVLARMDNMSAIAEEMEGLVEMARGNRAFASDVAEASLARLAVHAAETEGLFLAPEADPMSEARPEIWSDFPDFAARTREMQETIDGTSNRIRTSEDLRIAVQSIGRTCTACHDLYREEK